MRRLAFAPRQPLPRRAAGCIPTTSRAGGWSARREAAYRPLRVLVVAQSTATFAGPGPRAARRHRAPPTLPLATEDTVPRRARRCWRRGQSRCVATLSQVLLAAAALAERHLGACSTLTKSAAARRDAPASTARGIWDCLHQCCPASPSNGTRRQGRCTRRGGALAEYAGRRTAGARAPGSDASRPCGQQLSQASHRMVSGGGARRCAPWVRVLDAYEISRQRAVGRTRASTAPRGIWVTSLLLFGVPDVCRRRAAPIARGGGGDADGPAGGARAVARRAVRRRRLCRRRVDAGRPRAPPHARRAPPTRLACLGT